MKKICVILLFSFKLLGVYAQENTFKQNFKEANTLIEENQFKVALPIWLKLQKQQPTNSNLNYKIGLCYMESSNQKGKALSYLTTASKNITTNYDPFAHSEKKAPVEVYYYLARAQHLNYKLDKAISNYDTFRDGISKKHYLYKDIDRQKKYCDNAKIAIASPIKTKITNMGNVINSKYEDYSPAILFDESTIYFTSRRLRNDSSNLYTTEIADGKFYEDIYVAHQYNGSWSKPEPININTSGHEAVVNISSDGKTLFLYQDDKGDGNIYQSTLMEDGEWSYPTSLNSNINQKSQETHAHLSPDGKSLYFVSDRKNGTGGKDIYVCKQLTNGNWDAPQNVGNAINTTADEDGVFIHPDGKTMYFSSTGHNSIGGYDVFSSKLDENGNWSKPVNMGYPINSTDNDLFFVTSADGKRGYYSSYQEDGFGEKDIYRISLENETAKPITLLAATIEIHGYDTLSKNTLLTIIKKGSNEATLTYRKEDGSFSAILQPESQYHITYFADTYTKEEDITTPATYSKLKRKIILNYSEPKDNSSTSGAEIASYQEYFNYNNKSINTEHPKYLNVINKIIKEKSTGKIYVSIETSASHVPTKTFGSNKNLAKERAKDAKSVIISSLASKGINKENIIFNAIKQGVNGPEYNSDYNNKSIYEKYQYVIITIK